MNIKLTIAKNAIITLRIQGTTLCQEIDMRRKVRPIDTSTVIAATVTSTVGMNADRMSSLLVNDWRARVASLISTFCSISLCIQKRGIYLS